MAQRGAGVAAFLAVTFALRPVSMPVGLAFALVSALLMLTAAAMRPPAPLPARCHRSVGRAGPDGGGHPMVLGLTAVASWLGPIWTGSCRLPCFALVLGASRIAPRDQQRPPSCCGHRAGLAGQRGHVRAGLELARSARPGLDVRVVRLVALATSALALAWGRSRPLATAAQFGPRSRARAIGPLRRVLPREGAGEEELRGEELRGSMPRMRTSKSSVFPASGGSGPGPPSSRAPRDHHRTSCPSSSAPSAGRPPAALPAGSEPSAPPAGKTRRPARSRRRAAPRPSSPRPPASPRAVARARGDLSASLCVRQPCPPRLVWMTSPLA